MAWLCGFPEHGPGALFGPCDPGAGLHALTGLLVALEHRRRTGEGRLVECPMVANALNVAGEQVIEYSANGVRLDRTGNRGLAAAPQNCYAAADWDDDLEPAPLGVDRRRHRRAVAGAARARSAIRRGRPTPRSTRSAGRMAAHDELDADLAAWCAERKAAEIVDELWPAGVPCAVVVHPSENLTMPQLVHRRLLRARRAPRPRRLADRHVPVPPARRRRPRPPPPGPAARRAQRRGPRRPARRAGRRARPPGGRRRHRHRAARLTAARTFGRREQVGRSDRGGRGCRLGGRGDRQRQGQRHRLRPRGGRSCASTSAWSGPRRRSSGSPPRVGRRSPSRPTPPTSRRCRRSSTRRVRRYSRLDVMHNNVGVGGTSGLPDQIEPAAWAREIDQNLTSAYMGIRCAAPVMRAAGRRVDPQHLVAARRALPAPPDVRLHRRQGRGRGAHPVVRRRVRARQHPRELHPDRLLGDAADHDRRCSGSPTRRASGRWARAGPRCRCAASTAIRSTSPPPLSSWRPTTPSTSPARSSTSTAACRPHPI